MLVIAASEDRHSRPVAVTDIPELEALVSAALAPQFEAPDEAGGFNQQSIGGSPKA